MTSFHKRSLPGLDTLSMAATALSRSASNLFRADPQPIPGVKPVGKLPEWKVMCQEAAELAKNGEKEEALMLYHRALRMRPNAPEIKTAIRNITNNITESIQANKTMKLFATMKVLAHKKKIRKSSITGDDLLRELGLDRRESSNLLTRDNTREPISAKTRLPPIGAVLPDQQTANPGTLPAIVVSDHTTEEPADRDRVKLGNSDFPLHSNDNIPDSSQQESHVSEAHPPEPTHKDNPPGPNIIPPLNLKGNSHIGKDSIPTPRSGRVRKKSSHRRKDKTKVIPPLTFRSLVSLNSTSDTEDDVLDKSGRTVKNQEETDSTNIETKAEHLDVRKDDSNNPTESGQSLRKEQHDKIQSVFKGIKNQEDGNKQTLDSEVNKPVIPVVSVSQHEELDNAIHGSSEQLDIPDTLNGSHTTDIGEKDEGNRTNETVVLEYGKTHSTSTDINLNDSVHQTKTAQTGLNVIEEKKSLGSETEPTINSSNVARKVEGDKVGNNGTDKNKHTSMKRLVNKTRSLYKSPRAAALILETLSGKESSSEKMAIASLLDKPRVEEDNLKDLAVKGPLLRRSNTSIVPKPSKAAPLKKTSSLKSIKAEPLQKTSAAPPQPLRRSSTTLAKTVGKVGTLKETSSLKSIHSENGSKKLMPPPQPLRRSSTTLAKQTTALPPIQKSQDNPKNITEAKDQNQIPDSSGKLLPPQQIVRSSTSLNPTQNTKQMRPPSKIRRGATSLQASNKINAVSDNSDPIRDAALQTRKEEKKEQQKEQKRKTSNPKAAYSLNSKLLKGKTPVASRGGQHKVELQKKLEEQKGMPLEQMSEETQLQFKKACAKAVILAKSNVALTVKEKDMPRPDSRSADWQQEAPEFLLESTQRLENPRPTSPGSSPREYALAELKRIQTDFDEERYEKARYRSGIVLEKIQEAQVDDTFTEVDRQNVMANLYSCQGNASLELGLMDDALDAHLKDLHIGTDFNLLDSKSRGLVNVGRVHARTGRFRDAIDVWGDKVALCVSSEERAWLFHEMGRCYYEMDEYADAHHLADKACVNAQETSDVDMQFKASYLLAQCYEQLQEIEEALIEYKKAHDLALVSDNEEELEKIQEAIQRLNEQLAAKIINSRRRLSKAKRRVRLPAATLEDETDPITARGIDVGDSKSTPTSELYYMTLLYVMSTLPEC